MLKEARKAHAEEWARVSGVWQSRVYMAAFSFSWVNMSMILKLSEPQFAHPKVRMIIIIAWTFPLGKTRWTQFSSWPSAISHSSSKVRIGNVNRYFVPLMTSKRKANLLGHWPALTKSPHGISSYPQKHKKTVHGKIIPNVIFLFLNSNM